MILIAMQGLNGLNHNHSTTNHNAFEYIRNGDLENQLPIREAKRSLAAMAAMGQTVQAQS